MSMSEIDAAGLELSRAYAAFVEQKKIQHKRCVKYRARVPESKEWMDARKRYLDAHARFDQVWKKETA